MKQSELVSVIVPVYNSEKYLEQCLGSIRNQSYTNLEIIVIDDGSTDNSLSICTQLAEKDNRLRVCSIPNGGVSNARNQGIEKATGTYIQFVDSDDYLPQIYIATLVAVLEAQNADLAICCIKTVDFKGVEYEYWCMDNVRIPLVSAEHYIETLYSLIKTFLLFGPVNKLYKKQMIDARNVRFKTDISYGEDLIFNLDYIKKEDVLVVENSVYYPYLQDNTVSLSKKPDPNKIEYAKEVHHKLITFLESVNCRQERFDELLYQRLFDYYYNQSFLIANDSSGSFWKRYRHLKKLFKDKILRESYTYIPDGYYASWIITIMKNNWVLPFLIAMSLQKYKREQLKKVG